jgi:hypothetical protein
MVCRGAQCSADDGDRREERNFSELPRNGFGTLRRGSRRVVERGRANAVASTGRVTYWLGKRSEVGWPLRNFGY